MIPRDLIRPIVVVALIALPVLSLVILGLAWLWQSGGVLVWSAAALCCAGLAWWAWPKAAGGHRPDQTEISAEATGRPEPDWSPQDEKAWKKVCALAREIDPDQVKTQADLADQAQRTIDLVARHYHPDTTDALWRFTLPEALLLIEQTAGRLRQSCHDQVPLSDRLRISELRWLYSWGPAVRWLGRAWDWWRVGRSAVNPLGALSAEIRERIIRELKNQGTTWVQRRLVQLFVEEVGRSSIDLYSGRLRVTHAELAGRVSKATDEAALAEDAMNEPLRILIAGQTNVGKSSLVNALAGETKAAVDVLPISGGYLEYRLERENASLMQLVDAPAAALQQRNLPSFLDKAEQCDLVIWVSAADRADRAADRTALEALNAHFADRPERLAPSVIVAASHVDRLRPFREWSPPYDVQTPSGAKAGSIRQALDVISADLRVPLESIVPVRLDTPDQYYNVDVLWARILECVPEARRARLIRLRHDRDWDWWKVVTQARGTGRLAVKALLTPGRATGASERPPMV